MSHSVPRVLFISDFHIGEKLGSVRTEATPDYEKLNKLCYVRNEFNTFLNDLKTKYGIDKHNKLKYLVIMGDQWDLAVQPMPYAFNLSIDFFTNSDLANFVEEIIYLPGNHDHHIWRMYQSRYCVTEQLEEEAGHKTTEYPQVISGYLDLSGPEVQLDIEKVNGYGSQTSFLTGLTGGVKIPVNIVYPNLYIIYNDRNNQKKATLCTHGHLFDAPWNLITDVIFHITKIFSEGKRFDLHDIEMLNSPVTEFWNYSMAQTGKYNVIDKFYDLFLVLEDMLSGWIKTIFNLEKTRWEDIRNNKEKDPKSNKGLLDGKILEQLKNKSRQEMETLLEKIIKKVIGEAKDIRAFLKDKAAVNNNRSEFLYRNQERVVHYIEKSVQFLSKYGLTYFDKLIYGHTHQPENQTVFKPDGTGIELTVFNTGGWVAIDDKDYPQLFLLSDKGEFTPLT